jgi:hypothetical protein
LDKHSYFFYARKHRHLDIYLDRHILHPRSN